MRALLFTCSLFILSNLVLAQGDDLKKMPITTASGPVGDLLRQWWKEGTAAGNVGDWYDNRDGAHSDLNTTPYPQLQRIVYTPEQIKFQQHWALARTVRPQVTFGNSSTSAPPTMGGSNPRSYYCSTQGLQLLYQHYISNNVYIYPEHRDHDPGHNGKGDGFGDMYPTNTPYLYISQGSSGSDQPFMRAIPFTLAAFRPEAKKLMTESGLLMPTLQMIFRSSNKQLKSPKDYMTALAHPTVFEGSWVDDLAMVKMAHEIVPGKIPPLVQLKVLEEENFQAGRDYFDPGPEKIADTPCVIARIFRAPKRDRRFLISAEGSKDVNRHPLTFTWTVLRGDKEKIQITPKNKEESVVEIVVPYHERRPIAPGSPMESNRVDIAVFAHNGFYPSAPAFLTLYSLDSESRVYDSQGRISEIGYGMGEVNYQVTNWSKWLEAVNQEGPLQAWWAWSPKEKTFVQEVSLKHQQLQKMLANAQERKDAKEIQAANKVMNDFLDGKGEPQSLRKLADDRLRKLAQNPKFLGVVMDSDLWNGANPNRQKAVQTALAQYTGFGWENPKTVEPKTAYALARLELLHGVLLSQIVFPDSVQANFQQNFVDQRLSVPKTWRDVYHYHKEGPMLGWTRYDGQKAWEMSVQGLIVETKDPEGKCTSGKLVKYHQEPVKNGMLNSQPLQMQPTDIVVRVEYANPQDWQGKILRKDDAK